MKNQPRRSIWLLADSASETESVLESLRSEWECRTISIASSRDLALAKNQTPDLILILGPPPLAIVKQVLRLLPPSVPFMGLVRSACESDLVRALFELGSKAVLPVSTPQDLLAMTLDWYALAQVPGLRLDPMARTVSTAAGIEISLTHKELQILELLQNAYPRPVSRQEMIERVWRNVRVTTKTLDVHLFYLRKKIRTLQLEVQFVAPRSYVLNFTCSEL